MLFSFLCQSTSASFTLSLNSVHFRKASCVVVKSFHFTISLGMIGTCDVISNACELIKLVSDLKSITKKKKIHGYTQIAWSYTVHK